MFCKGPDIEDELAWNSECKSCQVVSVCPATKKESTGIEDAVVLVILDSLDLELIVES